MGGAFHTSRDIFEHPIWQNIVEFRLFFLLYGKAAYVDGVRIGNITLKRGQWVRSVRNLQSDLEYLENRAVKRYSLSKIHRTINKLVKENRITAEPCELGTLFTIVNYAKYQGLENYKNDNGNAERTQREQGWNGDGTEMEQQRNNNNNTNKTNKTKKTNKYIGKFTPPTLEEIKTYCLERNNNIVPEQFFDFYESKGWMVGKNKMKDWKAAVRTWERNRQQDKPARTNGNIFLEDDV